MNKWTNDVKEKARDLREKGASFSQITKTIGVPKSTLHYWVSDLGPSPYQSAESMAMRFKVIQKMGALANRKKKEIQVEEIIKTCKAEVGLVNHKDKILMQSMLSMLYWAEGTKHEKNASVKFVNTDPKLILLFLTLFRKCFDIDESKFRLRLHLHYYHNIKESKIFWSDLSGIPLDQFGKIYIKKRSETKKFRRNYMGICFVIYHDVKLLRYITNFGYELGDKINGSL